MPRRKNQSPNAGISGRDSTENVAQNSDAQRKWRDTQLHDLQSMFAGSIDPEVVQLVLSESNYNVNDAVEKLFVLSGIEQGQTESKAAQDNTSSQSPVSQSLDSMSSKRQKPNSHDEVLTSGQSDLVLDSNFTESHAGATAMISAPSTLGNLPNHSSSTLTPKDAMKPNSVDNAVRNQLRPEVPRTLPSAILPFNPLFSESIRNGQVMMPPDLCAGNTSPVMSSGIPDFPDNISQQYKTLKDQSKGAVSVQRLFSQETPGQNNLVYNTNSRPPFAQKVPGHFEFGRPPDVTLHMGNHDQEFKKGNLETLLKQVISGNASIEDWKKVSQTRNTEKRELDLVQSKNGAHNQNTSSAACSSDNKTQVSHNKNQGTLNSDRPIQTNNQNSFSNPNNNANRPHLQQKTNTVNQQPNQSRFNTLPKESIFHPPPPIQRQFQPFVPPQGFRQSIPGNMCQQRFALMPTPRSPWQQGPVVQRPTSGGRMPFQYHPQGPFPFQPPHTFGRAHPTAAARQPAARQSLGVAVPFNPTIHQKLFIVIRGLPGSGKSSLAQRLKGAHGVVFSTDDYFYRNQRYEFDVSLLGEAHEWNQKRAKGALEKLQSPVIIDNTNTQAWEMKPYVAMALRHGYHIKFVEPDTSWKWNVKELTRRNQHGVSIVAITRMKERYEHGVTVEKIMNSERKLDKPGNESEARKGTGADNQNAKPRPPGLPQERGSQNLGTGKPKSYGVPSDGGKTNPKIEEERGGITSRQVTEAQNNVEAKEGVQELGNSSERDVNVVEKPDNDAKHEEAEESCTSVLHGIDISEVGNKTDVVIKEETNENSCPKPQRVQRVRERKSPNRQQEQQKQQQRQPDLSTLVCEDEMSAESQDIFTSCDRHDESDVNFTSSSGSAPKEEDSTVFRVQKLSTLASLANSCMASPAPSTNGNIEDSQSCVKVTPEVSESSLSPLLETPLAKLNSPVHNASSVESNAEENEDRSVFSKESIKGKLTTCDMEFPDTKTFSPFSLTSEDDVTEGIAESGSDAVKHQELFGNNSFRTPPPLSALLASASRTKLKMRSRSNSDPTQPITDSVQSSEESGPNYSDTNQAGDGLDLNVSTQSVPDEASSQETDPPAEDVFSDAQNLSDQSDSLQTSPSGALKNGMTSGVEFLKTCFPDVDSELMNALLDSNSGDVMKVVDVLLASENTDDNAEENEATEQDAPNLPAANELPAFPDSLLLASINRPFHALNEERNFLVPTEKKVEAVEHVSGFNQESTNTLVNGEISSKPYAQGSKPRHVSDLGPSPMAKAQSPSQSNAATFQLTLEPAVALHLIEMFGSFAGIDFRENIRPDDLIIDVDSSLARQLYKKWERSVQIRKGIPAIRDSPQRAKRKPNGIDSIQLTRDQSPSSSRRSPSRARNEPQAGNLREIMDEQLALELSRNVPDVTEQDIATKMKRQKLYEMFPGIDPVALEEVFQSNRFELAPSVEAVKASCDLHGRPNTVIASGFSGQIANQREAVRKEAEEDWSWLYLDDSSQPKPDEVSFQTLDEPSYLDYRTEAFQHHQLRDECFKKAALAFSKKQGQLAQFYAQQGHMHTQKIKEANARAAALILNQKNELTDENTIDLHGLHVTEAVEALEDMLNKRSDPHGSQARKGCKVISVVTGRGNHSRGGKARIKPAILEYLKKHNYRFTEPHPGLVKVYL